MSITKNIKLAKINKKSAFNQAEDPTLTEMNRNQYQQLGNLDEPPSTYNREETKKFLEEHGFRRTEI